MVLREGNKGVEVIEVKWVKGVEKRLIYKGLEMA
jgi:hypothetical protein